MDMPKTMTVDDAEKMLERIGATSSESLRVPTHGKHLQAGGEAATVQAHITWARDRELSKLRTWVEDAQDNDGQIRSLSRQFFAEEVDRFGNGLVDRFVESHHVLGHRSVTQGAVRSCPQPKHACAQRTIFTDELRHGEAVVGAQRSMHFGCCVWRAPDDDGEPMRLGGLVRVGLWTAKVGADSAKNLWRVVP